MKKYSFILLILLSIVSCKKSEPASGAVEAAQFVNKDWDRIRIPDGGQVQAVAGNIKDTLLVTTLHNTYLVTNNGATFTLTSKHLNNTPGLYVSRDTIFALSGSSYDAKFEKHYASIPSYYTIDKGVNWKPVISRNSLYMENGVVTTKSNVIIKLNYHSGPDMQGKGNSYVLKTTISKTENGNTSSFNHPVQDEQPTNLYLDQQGRLYISTGGSFSESGVLISSSISSPAYLYISKASV